MRKNCFITLEGVEGAGKSTAISFIKNFLEKMAIPCVFTREPGGTSIGNDIRNILLSDYSNKMSDDTELLLMFASRAQNIEQIIKPALQEGKWVICDRFTDASYAYQGGGRGIAMEKIAIFEKLIHPDLHPALTILLDVPVEIGAARIDHREKKDRIEQEKLDFFDRVRGVYLGMAQQFPERFKVIDATQSLAEVEKNIISILTDFGGFS